MKKAILLTLLIIGGNMLRYYHGGYSFRSTQPYRIREFLSMSYKIVVYLIPALFLFRSSRHQSRNITWSTKRGLCAMVLLVLLVLAKQISVRWGISPHLANTLTLMTYGYVLLGNSVIEEWVFRGMLFSSLEKKYHLQKANILQAIFFGLVHLPVYIWIGRSGLTLVGGILGVMCLGYLRGVVKKETGSLFYPVVLHSIWNGVLLFT